MLTTCAQTNRPPQRISSPFLNERRLGLNSDGKIALFIIGDGERPSLQDVTEPDDINLDALSFNVTTFNPSRWGVTEDQLNKLYRFNQLGLMYKLYQRYYTFSSPGFCYERDSHFLTLLRSSLSEDITNPDDVVSEFVRFWNETMALYAEGPVDSNNQSNHFIFSRFFTRAVNEFCDQLVDTILTSDLYTNSLSGFSDDSQKQMLRNVHRSMLKSIFYDPMLFPAPLDAPSDQMNARTMLARAAISTENEEENRRTGRTRDRSPVRDDRDRSRSPARR